ncbi:SWI/SNF complex subunit SMARCC2 [Vairimorpha necatrix]|uniref:SWI/SNF complex subunit SMARCC2 n=1 Tax=Vairimorpha necatrix TaxID=6039 RepID=A0AAX4JBY1_9MICR
MENVYPVCEKIEFEEIYGKKRENALPPRNKPTYVFNTKNDIKYKYKQGLKYKWFNMTEISSYEINYFGQIPKYLEIRNIILENYEKSLTFLSLKTVLNILSSHKFANVFKIYNFLDKIKMINNRDIIGECEEALKNINVINKPKKEEFIPNIIDTKNLCICQEESQFFSKDNFFICEKCLRKGKFPEHLNVKIKLLEAIEKYGDDWTNVANFVETKSKHECIYHFIMLPILENNLSKIGFSTHMPFMLSSNPVTHILVFLSSVIHPSVAASAAKICIKEISNQTQNLLKTMLNEAKKKSLEIIELETKKIKRLENVLEESLTNLILLKIRSLKNLQTNIEKVREELIEAKSNL